MTKKHNLKAVKPAATIIKTKQKRVRGGYADTDEQLVRNAASIALKIVWNGYNNEDPQKVVEIVKTQLEIRADVLKPRATEIPFVKPSTKYKVVDIDDSNKAIECLFPLITIAMASECEAVVKMIIEHMIQGKHSRTRSPANASTLRMMDDRIPENDKSKNDPRIWLEHVAAYHGSLSIVSMIFERFGGDINVRDEKGHTPIMYAIRAGKLETVKYLIDQNAIADEANDGTSVFQYAEMLPDGITRKRIIDQLLLARGLTRDANEDYVTLPDQRAEQILTDDVRSLKGLMADLSSSNNPVDMKGMVTDYEKRLKRWDTYVQNRQKSVPENMKKSHEKLSNLYVDFKVKVLDKIAELNAKKTNNHIGGSKPPKPVKLRNVVRKHSRYVAAIMTLFDQREVRPTRTKELLKALLSNEMYMLNFLYTTVLGLVNNSQGNIVRKVLYEFEKANEVLIRDWNQVVDGNARNAENASNSGNMGIAELKTAHSRLQHVRSRFVKDIEKATRTSTTTKAHRQRGGAQTERTEKTEKTVREIASEAHKQFIEIVNESNVDRNLAQTTTANSKYIDTVRNLFTSRVIVQNGMDDDEKDDFEFYKSARSRLQEGLKAVVEGYRPTDIPFDLLTKVEYQIPNMSIETQEECMIRVITTLANILIENGVDDVDVNNANDFKDANGGNNENNSNNAFYAPSSFFPTDLYKDGEFEYVSKTNQQLCYVKTYEELGKYIRNAVLDLVNDTSMGTEARMFKMLKIARYSEYYCLELHAKKEKAKKMAKEGDTKEPEYVVPEVYIARASEELDKINELRSKIDYNDNIKDDSTSVQVDIKVQDEYLKSIYEGIKKWIKTFTGNLQHITKYLFTAPAKLTENTKMSQDEKIKTMNDGRKLLSFMEVIINRIKNLRVGAFLGLNQAELDKHNLGRISTWRDYLEKKMNECYEKPNECAYDILRNFVIPIMSALTTLIWAFFNPSYALVSIMTFGAMKLRTVKFHGWLTDAPGQVKAQTQTTDPQTDLLKRGIAVGLKFAEDTEQYKWFKSWKDYIKNKFGFTVTEQSNEDNKSPKYFNLMMENIHNEIFGHVRREYESGSVVNGVLDLSATLLGNDKVDSTQAQAQFKTKEETEKLKQIRVNTIDQTVKLLKEIQGDNATSVWRQEGRFYAFAPASEGKWVEDGGLRMDDELVVTYSDLSKFLTASIYAIHETKFLPDKRKLWYLKMIKACTEYYVHTFRQLKNPSIQKRVEFEHNTNHDVTLFHAYTSLRSMVMTRLMKLYPLINVDDLYVHYVYKTPKNQEQKGGGILYDVTNLAISAAELYHKYKPMISRGPANLGSVALNYVLDPWYDFKRMLTAQVAPLLLNERCHIKIIDNQTEPNLITIDSKASLDQFKKFVNRSTLEQIVKNKAEAMAIIKCLEGVIYHKDWGKYFKSLRQPKPTALRRPTQTASSRS